MRIKSIDDQIRSDLYGKLECEHCGNVQKFVGYDDNNWHDNVLRTIKCKACGLASEDAKAA